MTRTSGGKPSPGMPRTRDRNAWDTGDIADDQVIDALLQGGSGVPTLAFPPGPGAGCLADTGCMTIHDRPSAGTYGHAANSEDR